MDGIVEFRIAMALSTARKWSAGCDEYVGVRHTIGWDPQHTFVMSTYVKPGWGRLVRRANLFSGFLIHRLRKSKSHFTYRGVELFQLRKGTNQETGIMDIPLSYVYRGQTGEHQTKGIRTVYELSAILAVDCSTRGDPSLG